MHGQEKMKSMQQQRQGPGTKIWKRGGQSEESSYLLCGGLKRKSVMSFSFAFGAAAHLILPQSGGGICEAVRTCMPIIEAHLSNPYLVTHT